MLVNEKTGEYDFELGLLMLVSGCNVTAKNVKTNKIFPSDTYQESSLKRVAGGDLCIWSSPPLPHSSIHTLLSSQCFKNPLSLVDLLGTLK